MIVGSSQVLFMDEVVGMPFVMERQVRATQTRGIPESCHRSSYIVKIFGVPVAMQHQGPTVPVRRYNRCLVTLDVQQDDLWSSHRPSWTSGQRQTSVIQTVQKTSEVPQSRQLDRVVDAAVGIQRQTTDDPMFR